MLLLLLLRLLGRVGDSSSTSISRGVGGRICCSCSSIVRRRGSLAHGSSSCSSGGGSSGGGLVLAVPPEAPAGFESVLRDDDGSFVVCDGAIGRCGGRIDRIAR